MDSYYRTIRHLVGPRRLLLPGVRAMIVNEAGEILLQRRTDMPVWALPAGSVELDETALEAIQREVKEETALNILEAEPLALYSGPSQLLVYPNGDEIECFSVAFIVRRWEGHPRADGKEGSEVRFFPLSRLPENILAIHVPTIADYQRYEGRFILA